MLNVRKAFAAPGFHIVLATRVDEFLGTNRIQMAIASGLCSARLLLAIASADLIA
jgi:hypothetical protein